jgi:hypothetical protein
MLLLGRAPHEINSRNQTEQREPLNGRHIGLQSKKRGTKVPARKGYRGLESHTMRSEVRRLDGRVSLRVRGNRAGL